MNVATMVMLSIGGDLPKLGITAAIGGIFIFVCVSALDCIDDFKANFDDMDHEERTTNLGEKLQNAPCVMFKCLTF